MKSIRRRISAWMLPGLAIVWVIGGIAVHRAYYSALLSSIDSENMTAARLVRMEQRSQGRRGGAGFGRANRDPKPQAEGLFYQVWDLNGETLAKSANLGTSHLPFSKTSSETIINRTLALPSKKRIRMMITAFGAGHSGGSGQGFGPSAGGGSMPMVIVVGRDLSETDSRMDSVLIVIVGSGLLMLGGMALLLKLALHKGLRPLDALATAVSDIDPSSLHSRFSTGDEPLELKPIVSHLDRLMERVEKGFLRERRFGADLAHELRTPIAEMRTKLDLAEKWPEERNDEFFSTTREINRRMQRVVDTLLQLAHLEVQQGSFRMEPVLLAPLVGETWSPLKEMAAARNLKAEIRCPETATIPGNPELWRHILVNLFSNAVDYTPEGGAIHLAVNDDGISVFNTVGEMESENAERMFERFWRADGSRSDSQHSGLGLSLVQACAHDMGFHASASLEQVEGDSQLVISVRISLMAL